MLAVKADLDNIVYPVLASPKFDGVRCVTKRGAGALCRSLLSVPNEYIRQRLEPYLDLDGELIVGPPTAKNVFNVTQSAVMSREGFPDFRFYVFDHLGMGHKPFWERLGAVALRELPDFIVPVEHQCIHDREELDEYVAGCYAAGYEGAMLRSLDGPYKHGRSTLKQGWLLKVKNFLDAEAVIVGYEELMINGNAPTINALGLQKRSHHKDGKYPGNMLGAFVVKTEFNGVPGVRFSIGTGFTDEQRRAYWEHRDQLVGQTCTFKYQKEGSKDRPRIPVWKGFRDIRDL